MCDITIGVMDGDQLYRSRDGTFTDVSVAPE
jgi:hypothetical protein